MASPSDMQAPTDFFMRNILGPLTTTFTPNPDCSTLRGDGVIATSQLALSKSQACPSASQPVDQPTCWPHLDIPYPDPRPLRGFGLYSPGLHCPVGHTSACSRKQAQATGASRSRPRKPAANFNFEFDLFTGETAAGCCPIGYDCANIAGGAGQTCMRIASSTTITQLPCGTNKPDPISLPLTTDDAGHAMTIDRATLFAPLIQLVWKESDINAGVAKATQTASYANYTSSSQSSDVDTPAGTIVGAVLGAILGFLVLAGIFFYLLHRIRKRRKARQDSQQVDEKSWEKPELAVDSETARMKPVELFAEPCQELMTNHVFELPADNAIDLAFANHTGEDAVRVSHPEMREPSTASAGAASKDTAISKGAVRISRRKIGESSSASGREASKGSRKSKDAGRMSQQKIGDSSKPPSQSTSKDSPTSKDAVRLSQQGMGEPSKASGGPLAKDGELTPSNVTAEKTVEKTTGDQKNDLPACGSELARANTLSSQKSAMVSPVSAAENNKPQRPHDIEESPVSPENGSPKQYVSMFSDRSSGQRSEPKGQQQHPKASPLPSPHLNPFDSSFLHSRGTSSETVDR